MLSEKDPNFYYYYYDDDDDYHDDDDDDDDYYYYYYYYFYYFALIFVLSHLGSQSVIDRFYLKDESNINFHQNYFVFVQPGITFC